MILLRMLNDSTIETPKARLTPHARTIFSLGTYLIIERGKQIPRALLAKLFWPQSVPSAARSSLRRAIWKLRDAGFPILAPSEHFIMLPKDAAYTDLDIKLTEPDFAFVTTSFNILPWFLPTLSPEYRDWVDEVRYVAQHQLILRLEASAVRAKAKADWKLLSEVSGKLLELDPESQQGKSAYADASKNLDPVKNGFLFDPYYSPAMIYEDYSGDRKPEKKVKYRKDGIDHKPYSGHSYAPTLGSPLVGRTSEMNTLIGYLKTARLKEGSHIHITGIAGIGKSKLAREFAALATIEHTLMIYVTITQVGIQGSYQAIGSLLGALQDSPGGAGINPANSLVIKRVHEQKIGLDDCKIRTALNDLVECVTEEATVVLIVDNAHSMCSSGQAILHNLARDISELGVVLITISTVESVIPDRANPTDTGNTRKHTKLVLPRLSSIQIRQVATNFIKYLRKPHCSAAMSWACSITDGNPKDLEDALRLWSESQQMDNSSPHLIQLVQNKLRRLTPELLMTLQAIAISADNLSTELIIRLVGCSRQQLMSNIESLTQADLAEVIIEGSQSGQLSCQSDIVRTAAIDMIDAAVRPLMHHQIASTLSLLIKDANNMKPKAVDRTFEQLLWDCAFHYYMAGDSRWKGYALTAIDDLASTGRQDIVGDKLITFFNKLRLNRKDFPAIGKAQSKAESGNTLLSEICPNATSRLAISALHACDQDNWDTYLSDFFAMTETSLLDNSDIGPEEHLFNISTCLLSLFQAVDYYRVLRISAHPLSTALLSTRINLQEDLTDLLDQGYKIAATNSISNANTGRIMEQQRRVSDTSILPEDTSYKSLNAFLEVFHKHYQSSGYSKLPFRMKSWLYHHYNEQAKLFRKRLPETSDGEYSAVTYALIYALYFADSDTRIPFITSLVDRYMRTSDISYNPYIAAAHQSIIANGLMAAGLLNLAREVYTSLLYLSERTNVPRYRYEAFNALSYIAVDAENRLSAKNLLSQMTLLGSELDSYPSLQRDTLIATMQLNLFLNNRDKSEEQLAVFRTRWPNYAKTTSKFHTVNIGVDRYTYIVLLSIELRLMILKGAHFDDVVVQTDRVADLCADKRGRRQLQYAYFSIYLGLRYTGRKEEALSELAEYAQPLYLTEAGAANEIKRIFLRKSPDLVIASFQQAQSESQTK